MKKIKLLKTLYVDLLLLTMILIVVTPYLIRGGFSVFHEEVVEGSIITLLFMTGYAIYIFYNQAIARAETQIKEIEQNNTDLQGRIDETFRYIGELNVQISEIEEVFSAIKKYPENKKDFKQILEFLAEKILGIVPTPWVLLRIVDLGDESTVKEYCGVRAGVALLKHEIHNSALIKHQLPPELLSYTSGQDNLTIKAFCIFPEQKLTREQTIFLKAITNQLEMLFIVFTSPYTVHQGEEKRLRSEQPKQQQKQMPVKKPVPVLKKRGIFSFPHLSPKTEPISSSSKGTTNAARNEKTLSIDH
ncbi:hypothetical protein AUK40_00605 [Candidatus Wirthbacteria bacterium CG2_30_54_11]|uniref:Uncharacterized protein n=1 Tax=Candidatus Wirthbacteria bacterium CG2_30_54_11 TaxID=1817892 RepID=A0A1J5J828_9BACT|nr:MAG: hypothetical protein AUK40_00605 [Candidatus Wirthbacteria bacterium CG2_30_54_11]